MSREAIAARALDLTAEGGLSALSMRKLGAAFGVEAMSLYHYVKNKDDLLDAVLEQLYLEIELPTDLAEDDWEHAIRQGLHAFRVVLLGHPGALELFSSRSTPSAEAYGVLAWAWGRFEAVGLGIVEAHAALHFAVSFVMGFAANELGSLAQLRAGGVDVSGIDDAAMADRVRTIQSISPDETFATGLDAVVAGLRSRFDLP